MKVVCSDFESILVPEIWLEIANELGIDELKLTTRDVSDYQELMEHRFNVLREENIKLSDLKPIISEIEPLKGAKQFVKEIKKEALIIILTDSFYEFISPLLDHFDNPFAIARTLKIKDGYLEGYKPKRKEIKAEVIKDLKKYDLKISAVGDSYNDLNMLKEAEKSVLFKPSEEVKKEVEDIEFAQDFNELKQKLI